MKFSRRPTRDGFTLIEMVVAMILLAMLSVSLMRVVQTMNRISRSTASSSNHGGSIPRLIETLRTDFRNARGFATSPANQGNIVRLIGFVGRDGQTMMPDLTVEEVAYYQTETSFGTRIHRSFSTRPNQTQTLWLGDLRLAAIPLDLADASESEDGGFKRQWIQSGYMPMPLRMQVKLSDSRGIVWEEIFVHGS